MGPLAGLRIIELAGIGPGPFCAMMLADHGAEVIRVDRIGAEAAPNDPLSRSRRSLRVDLKQPDGVAIVRELARTADGLIDSFRPGVMERLGLGPDVLLAANERLVYGRMTGWGQSGPYAHAAGHDINYIALSGALHTCGRDGRPTPPVNYVGDFGGGAMMLAFGMLSALLAVSNGARGQVVDCAMTDGSALLTGIVRWLYAEGRWRDTPGVNLLDGGAPFYDTYRASDGRWIAIGALEPEFYALLREKLGLADDPEFDDQLDAAAWPRLKDKLAAIIATRPRADWVELFGASDACVTPVLSLEEAPRHPHNQARETYVEVGGTVQPAPAPRYSASALDRPRPPPPPGADTDAVLGALGYDAERIATLRRRGVVA